jgi:hypothetical protein
MKTIKLNNQGMYKVTDGVNSIGVSRYSSTKWVVGMNKKNGVFRNMKDAVNKAIEIITLK